ncbi:MAG: clan AA aspartic protease [Pirellulaceae bacterium]
MITGLVTVHREAVIRLVVRGPGDGELGIDAVIDTGFDGWLSLPPSLISRLGLPWRQRGRALLADGSESVFDTYEGIVVWDGHPRRVAVDEADTAPLIGMSLLGGYELTVQVRSGGNVTIGPLP